MGEDTDSTPTLNHRGFLPDHNYVTEGKKMTQEAVCVCFLYLSISFRQVCIYVLNFWSVSETECVTKLAQASFLSFYKLCVNYCSDRSCKQQALVTKTFFVAKLYHLRQLFPSSHTISFFPPSTFHSLFCLCYFVLHSYFVTLQGGIDLARARVSSLLSPVVFVCQRIFQKNKA